MPAAGLAPSAALDARAGATSVSRQSRERPSLLLEVIAGPAKGKTLQVAEDQTEVRECVDMCLNHDHFIQLNRDNPTHLDAGGCGPPSC